MAKTTYSFLDVVASITGPGGAISIGNGAGIAAEGISLDPSADLNTMTVGADGSGMHSLSGDRSGTITVRLLKTSPTNAKLQAMLAFQRSSGAAHGQNTITVVDTNRGDTHTCEQVAFAKQPSITYAKDGPLVEWTFHAVKMSPTLGGL